MIERGKKMKWYMDKITFEDRSEIDNIACALQEWLDKHPNDPKADDVKKMIGMLDSMYIGW